MTDVEQAMLMTRRPRRYDNRLVVNGRWYVVVVGGGDGYLRVDMSTKETGCLVT